MKIKNCYKSGQKMSRKNLNTIIIIGTIVIIIMVMVTKKN